MNWTDKLTDFQREHLKEHKVKTLEQFSDMREDQLEMEARYGRIFKRRAIVCYDCRDIAKVLGLDELTISKILLD